MLLTLGCHPLDPWGTQWPPTGLAQAESHQGKPQPSCFTDADVKPEKVSLDEKSSILSHCVPLQLSAGRTEVGPAAPQLCCCAFSPQALKEQLLAALERPSRQRWCHSLGIRRLWHDAWSPGWPCCKAEFAPGPCGDSPGRLGGANHPGRRDITLQPWKGLEGKADIETEQQTAGCSKVSASHSCSFHNQSYPGSGLMVSTAPGSHGTIFWLFDPLKGCRFQLILGNQRANKQSISSSSLTKAPHPKKL